MIFFMVLGLVNNNPDSGDKNRRVRGKKIKPLFDQFSFQCRKSITREKIAIVVKDRPQ